MDNNGYYDSKLGYTNNPNVYSNPVNPSQYYPNAPRPQQPNNGYVNNYSIPSDPANMQKKYKPDGFQGFRALTSDLCTWNNCRLSAP